MKRSEILAWTLALLFACLALPTVRALEGRPPDDNSAATTEPSDGSVDLNSMAAFDAGPFTFPGSGAPATMDDNSVALGTKTTGGYAASATEGGSATSVAANSVDGAGLAITSQATGDLMYYDGTDWVRLARGAAGTFLHGAASGAPAYAQLGASDVPAQLITSLMIENDTISDVDVNRWAPAQILMCPPGMNAVANICNTFTDLTNGAVFVSAGIGNFRWVDMDPYHSYRIQAYMGGTGSATADVIMQCASDITFNTGLTTLGQVDNPGATAITCSTSATCGTSSWADIPSGCDTAGGVYVRVGMINGNGTEDPVLRSATLELR